MGAGQSDLYKGTYGDSPENIPDSLKGEVRLPDDDSQLKHIFRKGDGHLEDTPDNRNMLHELANDVENYKGKDSRGNDWYYKNLDDGTQLWATSRNGVIQDGGLNQVPRTWDERTGLNRNVFRR